MSFTMHEREAAISGLANPLDDRMVGYGLDVVAGRIEAHDWRTAEDLLALQALQARLQTHYEQIESDELSRVAGIFGVR